MALVFVGEGRVSLEDEHGETATKYAPIFVDDVAFATVAARQAEAANVLEGWAEALDEVTDAVITSVSIRYDLLSEMEGLKTTPGDQGVGEGATIRLRKESGKPYPFWLPGAKAGVFLPDFRTIDISDTDLISFFTYYDGSGTSMVRVSDDEGVDLSVNNGMIDGWYRTIARSAQS